MVCHSVALQAAFLAPHTAAHTVAAARDCRAADPDRCRVHGIPGNALPPQPKNQSAVLPWERRQEEHAEKKNSWDTGTFTNAQKQRAIADFAKLRKEKTAELREKIGGTIESPIPGIPAVKVTGSGIKEMLNNKALWSSMALGASVDVHLEAAGKTREYVKSATPGKPVPTTAPSDPVKEKIYLDKQFTAKDGNTYIARYMVRVFKNSGIAPDVYFMNCCK